jgi:hypothetical protein
MTEERAAYEAAPAAKPTTYQPTDKQIEAAVRRLASPIKVQLLFGGYLEATEALREHTIAALIAAREAEPPPTLEEFSSRLQSLVMHARLVGSSPYGHGIETEREIQREVRDLFEKAANR